MCNYEKRKSERGEILFHITMCLFVFYYISHLFQASIALQQHCHTDNLKETDQNQADSSSVSKLAHQLPTKQFDLFVWKHVVFRPKQHCFKQHLLRQSLHLKESK